MVKLRWLGLLIALIGIVFFGVIVPAAANSPQAWTCTVNSRCPPSVFADMTEVPPAVVNEAMRLARELFGNYKEKYDGFVSQALSLYLETKDRDAMVIFNPGGWGWSTLERDPGWSTIVAGVKSELVAMDYTTLEFNHLRTEHSWRSYLNEFVEMLRGYPEKARDLALRVQFLTDSIPHLKVILAGESNGIIITDRAMALLADNARVYSIQTGRPFWYQNATVERTLVITDNGVTPDSFSRGDAFTIIINNLKAVFGLAEPVQDGTIMYFIRAPGHDYRWQYPKVRTEISDFLQFNLNPDYGLSPI